jgi:hypothetical protein
MTDQESEFPLEPPDRSLAERLVDERPVPAAGFREIPGRHLVAGDPGYGPRPARLRATVGLYLAGGGVIGALGALVAVGVL